VSVQAGGTTATSSFGVVAAEVYNEKERHEVAVQDEGRVILQTADERTRCENSRSRSVPGTGTIADEIQISVRPVFDCETATTTGTQEYDRRVGVIKVAAYGNAGIGTANVAQRSMIIHTGKNQNTVHTAGSAGIGYVAANGRSY